eukprot:g159.t1
MISSTSALPSPFSSSFGFDGKLSGTVALRGIRSAAVHGLGSKLQQLLHEQLKAAVAKAIEAASAGELVEDCRDERLKTRAKLEKTRQVKNQLFEALSYQAPEEEVAGEDGAQEVKQHELQPAEEEKGEGKAEVDEIINYDGADDGDVELEEADLRVLVEGSADFSVGGRGGLVVTGADDYTLRLWDLTSNTCKAVLSAHTSTVQSIAWLGANRLASASADKMVRVWDTKTSTVTAALGHSKSVRCVARLDNNRIVSGCDDKKLHIWDLTTKKRTRTLSGHSNYVYGVASVGAERIVSCSNDGTVRVWDVKQGTNTATLNGHGGSCVYAIDQIDANRIVSCSDDCTVRVWDLTSSTCTNTFNAPNCVYATAKINYNTVASGDASSNVCIWDLRSGQCTATLTGHSSSVWCVARINDHTVLSGSNGENSARVWDLRSNTAKAVLGGHTSAIYSVAGRWSRRG